MKGKAPHVLSRERLCEHCNKPMADYLRYFLQGTMDADIRGPYHSWCAKEIVDTSHRDHERLTQLIQPFDYFFETDQQGEARS